jgi:hypothetical protein
VQYAQIHNSKGESVQPWAPLLICNLPERGSADNEFMRASLNGVEMGCAVEREGVTEAPASMVVRSAYTGSRTIISWPGLGKEVTVDEVKAAFHSLGHKIRWWHFEVTTSSSSMKKVGIASANVSCRGGIRR